MKFKKDNDTLLKRGNAIARIDENPDTECYKTGRFVQHKYCRESFSNGPG